ncbi:MAG: nucleotidyl transferase AbiEii/AbiGii toxin family protein [Gammaproteobacteria bacterium]
MSDEFFQLPLDTQRVLLEGAENHLNVRASVIEKDIWICWLLKHLFALPIQMAFKGGTSLSKVFNLIERFSEDIDVTIDYRYFSDPIDFNKISKSQLKKLSKQLKAKLQDCTKNTILPFLQRHLNTTFPKNDFEHYIKREWRAIKFLLSYFASSTF